MQNEETAKPLGSSFAEASAGQAAALQRGAGRRKLERGPPAGRGWNRLALIRNQALRMAKLGEQVVLAGGMDLPAGCRKHVVLRVCIVPIWRVPLRTQSCFVPFSIRPFSLPFGGSFIAWVSNPERQRPGNS